MAELTVQTVDTSGVDDGNLTAAAGGGDEFENTYGNVLLRILNEDAGSHTVTIASQKTIEGLALADQDVAVPAGESRLIGPFRTDVFNDSNNHVQLTYDDVTSVTVGVFKFGS